MSDGTAATISPLGAAACFLTFFGFLVGPGIGRPVGPGCGRGLPVGAGLAGPDPVGLGLGDGQDGPGEGLAVGAAEGCGCAEAVIRNA